MSGRADRYAGERAADDAAAVASTGGHERSPALRLVAPAAPAGRVGEPARRLRFAPAVQLELVPAREAARAEVVWAGLPEPTRRAVLVLLARLIGAGALDEEAS